ncbi:hypothetical protein BJV82DRAFT_716146 [Fennellomyces sp. T-0311]|nr:hypothetical protein BJV82DRAFT_716146 [Fennellomyces sp. T-0311]
MASYEKLEFDYNDYYSFINLFEERAKSNADSLFIRYQLPNSQEYKTLTYAETDRIASNLASDWAPFLENVDSMALLADHSIYYLVSMLAIFKHQTVMMALSPRNSAAANIDLLTKTESRYLVASEKYERMARECASQVPGGCGVHVVPSLDLERLARKTPIFKRRPSTTEDIEKIALIIHSSGSTSFPKPIHLSNRYLFWLTQALSLQIQYDKKFLNSSDVMLSTFPLYHVFGIFTLFSPMIFGASSLIMSQMPPSSKDIIHAHDTYDVTMMAMAPVLLGHIADHIEETECDTLRHLKFVLYGGAPLRKQTGDFLQAKGINVRSVYGTTEINAMAISNIMDEHKEWDALKIAMPLEPYYFFEPYIEEKGIYHLVLKANYPAMATGVGNLPNGDYATKDLFKETPPNSGYWSYLGRKDDTLVMENGEKTNPVPMEEEIAGIKVVKCCTVIGESRPCTAVLVQLEMKEAIKCRPEEMIDQVHRAVKSANKVAPSFSRILPQMVYILPLNQELPTTGKGNVVRKKAIMQYEKEIDQLYEDFLHGPEKSDDDTQVDLGQFLQNAASKVLQQNDIDPDVSLFDYGLNSLLAIQLRNRISKRFENVPSNFLFEHPTLTSMAKSLEGQPEDEAQEREQRYKDTEEILDSYLKRAEKTFPVAVHTGEKPDKHTVLLTGTTGSLGAFMLRDLILSDEVEAIYCPVRGEGDLMKRIRESFKKRMLDETLLESKVQALPLKLDAPYLGWHVATYQKLKQEVTIVQHCAWMLDFNQPVQYYDHECIKGLYNLLKFAYRKVNPMEVHVVSSISATANSTKPIVPELPPPDNPHVAMPMGYAESKYIVEHLFNFLTKKKNFFCTVERMGQVCGDTKNGVWNTSEQYPLMMVGGTEMQLMPNLESVTVDWLPVDIAAASIADIMLKKADKNLDQSFFHIVNPHRIKWSDVLKAMRACGMQFSVVEPNQWVDALALNQDNPAYRLMSFFEANFKSDEIIKTMPVWDTAHTTEVDQHLGDCLSSILSSSQPSEPPTREELTYKYYGQEMAGKSGAAAF